MEHRKKVYKSARDLHPERFNRGLRNWNLPKIVALNPINESKLKIEKVG